MQRKRRHSPEIREEAVRQLRAGISVAVVGQTLGVNKTTVQYWRDVERRGTASATPGATDPAISPEVEVRLLRKEVPRLRGEQEFLKKAIAFFARASESDTP